MLMKNIAEAKAAAYKAHKASEKISEENLAALKKSFHFRAFIKSVAK